METLFHILGIVFYTVALLHLLAELRAKREEKRKKRDQS